VNSAKDLNSNPLLDDYTQLREDRDNSTSSQLAAADGDIWGKISIWTTGSGTTSSSGLALGDTRAYSTRRWAPDAGPTTSSTPTSACRQDQTVLPQTTGQHGMCLGFPARTKERHPRERLPTMANAQFQALLDAAVAQGISSGTVAMTRSSQHEMRTGMISCGWNSPPPGGGDYAPRAVLVQQHHRRLPTSPVGISARSMGFRTTTEDTDRGR
jgi:hypothetical protein